MISYDFNARLKHPDLINLNTKFKQKSLADSRSSSSASVALASLCASDWLPGLFDAFRVLPDAKISSPVAPLVYLCGIGLDSEDDVSEFWAMTNARKKEAETNALWKSLKYLGQARSWDMPSKMLETGSLLGQARSWDMPCQMMYNA